MDSQEHNIKGAQSVYRVLNILEALLEHGDAMVSPKELSASLNIPLATVHRLLAVLRQRNFVACDPMTKKYHIGESCLLIPRQDLEHDIRSRFTPLAEHMSRRFGYTTVLYARRGYEVVCVQRVYGWNPIQLFLNDVGDHRPLGMGSATLSILAALPKQEAENILARNEEEIREVLQTDFATLRRFLEQAREQGYAFSHGMLLKGAVGVSHALSMGGEVIGSIAVDAMWSEQWEQDKPLIIRELKNSLDP